MEPDVNERLARSIISWFYVNARDLPWRRTPFSEDPYAVYVSEIMLQQTQVKTVIPYWERWMRELPTIESLAMAPTERVLKLWEGLGYYRRARAMQKTAIWVMEHNRGEFPRTHEKVLDLPGVGPYTAGAICSIAYNQPTPIVDGNVIRVISRLERIQKAVEEPAIKRRIWKISTQLVKTAAELALPASRKACSELNQGLMEIGATICLPRQPRCPLCPLKTECKALGKGDQEKYPKLPKRVAYTTRSFVALLVERGGKYLVRQRSENVVNSGLWEFPNWEVETQTEKEALLKKLGIPIEKKPFMYVKHTITRYRITMVVYLKSGFYGEGNEEPNETWKDLNFLDALPFSSAHKKVLNELQNFQTKIVEQGKVQRIIKDCSNP